MQAAFSQAQLAGQKGEVPVGAVLALNGKIIAEKGNACIALHDPSAHAEMLVIREAAKKMGNYRLNGAELYVTLEPCTMCAGAISAARISRLIYAAADPKGGAVQSGVSFFEQANCHHAPVLSTGIMREEASRLLKEFFRERRSSLR